MHDNAADEWAAPVVTSFLLFDLPFWFGSLMILLSRSNLPGKSSFLSGDEFRDVTEENSFRLRLYSVLPRHFQNFPRGGPRNGLKRSDSRCSLCATIFYPPVG